MIGVSVAIASAPPMVGAGWGPGTARRARTVHAKLVTLPRAASRTEKR